MEAVKDSASFSEIQNIIIEFSKENGISKHQMHEDLENWKLSYKKDFSVRVDASISRLLMSMRLFHAAKAEGDLVAAKYGLFRASLCAADLFDFFENLNADLSHSLKFLQDVEMVEHSSIPEKYNFPKW